jgi:hypothetical protein
MGILKVEVKSHRDSGTAGSVEGKGERNNVTKQGQYKEKREIMWQSKVSTRKRERNNVAQQGQCKQK